MFQSLPSPPGLDLVDAIEGSTESPFSHCGVVVKKAGKLYVIEAIPPHRARNSLQAMGPTGEGQIRSLSLEGKVSRKYSRLDFKDENAHGPSL